MADVGELELLRRLQPFCARHLVGDDGAILPATVDNYVHVLTTDVFVDGVHFSDRTTTAEDVGWRAAAANLSDLAAMGATPVGITVGLSLPKTLPVAWVEGCYRGLADCLKTYGGEIIGGDICRAPVTSIAITALGQVLPQRAIRRDRARPGQVIVATGYHGASRAGLELLLHPERRRQLSGSDRDDWINRHQRPTPRLDVIDTLQEVADQQLAELAGMDSSDGLANAVLQLCQASGVGAQLMASHLPMPSALPPWVGHTTALDWCLYGGEDFELVLCCGSTLAQALLPQLGAEAAIVGTITENPAVRLMETDAADSGIELTWNSCFQHF